MNTQSVKAHDSACLLHSNWQRAQHVSLLLCRIQQRLESRLMVNTGIPILAEKASSPQPKQPGIAGRQKSTEREAYLEACEAEVLAMTEALQLQDAIPEIAATSLAGVVAKLEMIVGADREIGDPTDFPWPHIASVLRDLKVIAGELPVQRCGRATIRKEIARHWEAAARLIAALRGS